MRQLTEGELAVMLAIGMAVAVLGCFGPRMDGPIPRSDQVTVGLPTTEVPVTWGMPISTDRGPITLRRVELLEVRGLEVVGLNTCEGSPWTGDAYLNCAPTGGPWPPAGITRREVAGTAIGTQPDEAGGLIVGIQLAPGYTTGTIRGVRIEYAYADTIYVVDQPWNLEIGAQSDPEARRAAGRSLPW